MEGLIEQQFEVLKKAFKKPLKASEARLMISKKLLSLFRAGKLGPSYLMMSLMRTLCHELSSFTRFIFLLFYM